MSRDFWMTRRLTPTIDKLKQTLTLEAVDAECGRPHGSQRLLGGGSLYLANVVDFNLTERECTIEFWWKFEQLPDYFTERDIVFLSTLTQHQLKVRYDTVTNQFILKVTDSVPLTLDFNTGISKVDGVWNHYAVTREYAGGITTIKFYINGELVYEAGDAGLLNGNNLAAPYALYVGDQTSSSIYIQGWIAHVRLWQGVRTAEQIKLNYLQTLGTGGQGLNSVNATLLHSILMSFTETNPTSVPSLGIQDDISYVSNGLTAITLVDDDYPPFPLGFGASFVVARWDVTLDNQVSLEWPREAEPLTTGQLCVTWTDDDGVFQRRKLWSVEGVDIAPAPEYYAGENLGTTFSLELWNVDGDATTVMPETVLAISYCTNPTTSYDLERQAASTVTADTTLAESFPLTPFPLEFNEQQTY